ncbi:hypothetical protein [Baekduia soli]|nr:hypothetical protein [Baekduia soli]
MSWYVLLAIILGAVVLIGAVAAVAGGAWVGSRTGRDGRRR